MHEIDNSKGFDAFYGRSAAWHSLGQIVPDGVSAQEALVLAGLDYDVVKAPAGYQTEGGVFVPVPDKFTTYRTDTGAPLGVVGKVYTPVQNRDAFKFLDNLVDDGDALIETAGALRGGRKVFVTMAMPQTYILDPNGAADKIKTYLAVCNSHDGSSPLTAIVTPTRIVCANTERAAIRNAKSKWTIRHTTNATKGIDEARKALGLTFDYMDAFAAEAEALIEQEMTAYEFDRLIADVFPLDADATDRTKAFHSERRDTLHHLFAEAATQENIAGTKWAAEQAVVEYLDWFSPVRPRGGKSDAEARGENVIEDAFGDVKTDVHSRLLAV
jgi:phage/plasmid-like protein (TIGR03299 family)